MKMAAAQKPSPSIPATVDPIVPKTAVINTATPIPPSVHDKVLLRDVPRETREQLRPDDHADADESIQHAEGRRGREQHVAHVHREQRAEAAHREHARRHRENDERNRRVREDEAEALPHRIEVLSFTEIFSGSF